MRDFEGALWTQDIQWSEKNGKPIDAAQWGIRQLKGDTDSRGLSRDPNVIHCGRNSGFAAVNLAYLLGAERILLLGYDMQMQAGRRHWFGAHPEGLEVDSDYGLFMHAFRTIHPEKYGIEIWNLSRDTALSCFPRYDLDEICDRLRFSAQAAPVAA